MFAVQKLIESNAYTFNVFVTIVVSGCGNHEFDDTEGAATSPSW